MGDDVVDEDDLADGTDDTKEATLVSQDILVDFGADGAGSVELAMSDDLTDMGLTSDGVALDYTLSEDGTTLTATAAARWPCASTAASNR